MASRRLRDRLFKRPKEVNEETCTSSSGSANPVQSIAEAQSLGLRVLVDSENAVIDIVAVHGLNGHREKTWTASNDTLWLKDLLPAALPNARILSWGYDANTHSTSRIDQQYLYSHAKTLISDLCRKRSITETQKRPIIFVAHSLGGIVVKSALISSDAAQKNALEDHRAIAISTYGIIFMGTPHLGGNGVAFGQALTNVASIFVNADDKILKHLKHDSEFLLQQIDQYGPISGRFVTKFAYETLKTRTILGKDIMVVPMSSAIVPGVADAESIAIHADHKNMVKFVSQTDGGYEKVSDYLILMTRRAENIISNRWIEEERRTKGDDSFDIPFQLSDLPYITNYVPRPEEMIHLERALLPGKESTGLRISVLYGLGGIGKTQMAISFARQHQKSYSAILWINGDGMSTLLPSLSSVLPRVPTNRGKSRGAGDIKAMAQEALHWLSLPANKNWLLIYDNVDRDWSPDNSDPEAYDLQKYFPPADQGSIIVTTRLQSLASLGESLQVRPVSLDQGLRILTKDAAEIEITEDHRAIVKRLECLPLALALAGRYMFSTKTSPGKYLQLYQERWIELQKKHPQLREYGNGGIHTTWTISYERIRKLHPTAANLLILWAYFDKQDLWYGLLSESFYYQPDWYQELVRSELDFKDAVKTLLTYSLVEEHSMPDSYSMHSVVHEWCFEHFWEDNKQSMIPIALVAVGTMVPKDGRFIDSMLPRRLLPHAIRQDYLQSRTEGKLKEDLHGSVYERETTLRSLNGLGVLLWQHNRLAEANAFYIRALAGSEETLGSEHELTLDIFNNLGILFRRQGNLTESEAFYMRALSGYEKVLGPEHISTLDTIYNLGILFEKQGKLAESEAFYMRALSGKEKLLGPEHISTLETVNNLGNLFQKQGRLPEAENFYKRALSGMEKVLEPEHAKIVQVRRGLRELQSLGETNAPSQRR